MNIGLQTSLNLEKALTDVLTSTLEVVPRVIMAIVLLVIGLVVAKIIRKVIKKLLVVAKVDKLGESLNEIDLISKANMKIELSSIFSAAIYYFIVLIVLTLSSAALGMDELTQLVTDIVKFLPNLLVAIVIMILGTLLADALKSMLSTTLKSVSYTHLTLPTTPYV